MEGGGAGAVQGLQGVDRVGAHALEVSEALVEALVDLKAQVEEGDELVGARLAGALGGVHPPGRLAGALEDDPAVGARGQVGEEGQSAVLVHHEGAPPAEPGLFAPFSRPGHGELEAEDLVELLVGGRGAGRAGGEVHEGAPRGRGSGMYLAGGNRASRGSTWGMVAAGGGSARID